MSLAFSNTTSKNGIIQRIEEACGFPDGGISGNTTLMAKFTGKVNVALDKATQLLIQSSGDWQWDDTNHASFPEVFATLTSGTRRYSFTADAATNLILDIYKVYVKDPTGTYYIELDPVDAQDGEYKGFTDGLSTSGTPARYDKTGKWIDLDPVPNYTVNSTGIKILVNREASYFTTADTTKTPGIAGIFHEYLVLAPSYEYARDKQLPQMQSLQQDMLTMEQAMKHYYSHRAKDERQALNINREDAR